MRNPFTDTRSPLHRGDPPRGACLHRPRASRPRLPSSTHIGEAPLVLLGEATHGTHEFYRAARRDHAAPDRRARLRRGRGRGRLAGRATASTATCAARGEPMPTPTRRSAASGAFRSWMWRNADVRDFVELAARAQRRAAATARRASASTGSTCTACTPRSRRCCATSTASTRAAAERARERYALLRRTSATTPQAYGYAATRFGLAQPCERRGGAASCRAAARRAASMLAATARAAEDELLLRRAERAAGAERRALLPHHVPRPRRRRGTCATRHMAETLDALLAHLERSGAAGEASSSGRTTRTSAMRAPPRWADAGELNVGQLVRERARRRRRVCVGFTTHAGTRHRGVRLGRAGRAQARAAGAAGQLRGTVPRRRRSGDFLLPLAPAEARDALREPRLERAIGVIYRPDTERQSHYFHARAAAAVRRRDPHRRDARGRAARCLDLVAGRGRAAARAHGDVRPVGAPIRSG